MKQCMTIKKMDLAVIDKKGYRSNVGMIIINKENKVFWGRRIGQKSWQFPQGGIDKDETIVDAMYRELYEETGLAREDVEILSQTNDWLSYDLPKRYRRKNSKPMCIGQKQHWFLLRLTADDSRINLNGGHKAEFDAFRWVDYWYPIRKVIFFKRDVYHSALHELSEIVDVAPRKRLSPYSYQKKSKSKRQPRKNKSVTDPIGHQGKN